MFLFLSQQEALEESGSWNWFSGSMMLGPPGMWFFWPVLHDCKMAAAIPDITSLLSQENERKTEHEGLASILSGKANCFLHPQQKEVLLPLIGQDHHLTTCPPLTSRKLAKQKRLGSTYWVSQNHSDCHIQFWGHYINILSLYDQREMKPLK